MADKKISQLTAATTPLAGTEVLPIVQSGNTVKVSVANVTAGRAVSAQSFSANNTGLATPVGNFQSGDQAGARVAVVNSGAGGQTYHLVTGNPGIGNSGFALYDATNNATRLYVGSSTGNLTLNTGNLVVGTAGKGIDFSANGGDVLTQYDEGTWTPTDASGAGLSLTVANARFTRIGKMVFANFAITYPSTVNASTARLGGLPYASSSVGFSHPMAVSTCQTGICKSGLVDTSATTFLLLDTTGNALTVAQMSGLNLRGTVIYEAA